jgi:hypothetical protein
MNIACRFARNGKVFKELSKEDMEIIEHLVKTGVVQQDDDYWMPGMHTWKRVSTRNWSDKDPVPKPEANKPYTPPEPQFPEATSEPSPLRQAATTLCECMTCKKGFNEPAKAISGYSVIGKAVKFFIYSVAAQVAMGVVAGVYLAFRDNDSSSWFGMVIMALIQFTLAVLAIGLFLMAIFELISAAVTHGLYRANPERCPNCGSTTFSR